MEPGLLISTDPGCYGTDLQMRCDGIPLKVVAGTLRVLKKMHSKVGGILQPGNEHEKA